VCAWRVRNDDMKQPGFRRAHSRHHTLTSPQQHAHLRRCPSLSFLNLLAVPGYGRRSSRGLAKSRIISAFLLLGLAQPSSDDTIIQCRCQAFSLLPYYPPAQTRPEAKTSSRPSLASLAYHRCCHHTRRTATALSSTALNLPHPLPIHGGTSNGREARKPICFVYIYTCPLPLRISTGV
jgi:hypothetical protein